MIMGTTLKLRLKTVIHVALALLAAYGSSLSAAAQEAKLQNPFETDHDCSASKFSKRPLAKLAEEICLRHNQDQTAVWISPPESFKHLSMDEWGIERKNIKQNNRRWAEKVIQTHGYPGFDKVGKDASDDFWAFAQHADFDTDFQIFALNAMKKEVDKNNASKRVYALLIDRVRINTQQPQIYGSQTWYNQLTGQVLPRETETPVELNARRAKMELDPIEEYINSMTVLHYGMNKDTLQKNGIMIAPQFSHGEMIKLYKEGKLPAAQP